MASLKKGLPLALLLVMTSMPALAQKAAEPSASHHHGHPPDKAPGFPEAGAPLTEASKAYEVAAQKMHKDMASAYTNDVDVDFVRGMIPHHQGAIDQAEILLKYSTNPRLRRLAGGIIASQRREIRFMEKWLKARAAGAEDKDVPAWLKNNPSTIEEARKAGEK